MIRKFKALGLALVAVFAMSAMVATAAQATSGTVTFFPSNAQGVTFTAEQIGEHIFTLTDHKVTVEGKEEFANTKCKKAVFDAVGTVAAGATSVTVTPTYSECKSFGLTATIDHNGCNYILHSKTKIVSGWDVETTLTCPAGKGITITAATCEVTVSPQSLPHTSEVTNAGVSSPETGMDLHLHTDITGINYTVNKDGIGCPLSGTGNFVNGDYDGTTTIKAHDVNGNPVGITLH